jgi:O-antigen/teichoic acid export membrane protein
MASQESVANYGIASRLSSLVFLTVTFIMIPTITAVSSAFARNDNKTIGSIYSETLSTFSFLNNLITLLLCVLAERLLVIWIGFYTDEIMNFSLILLIGQSIAVLTTAIGVSVCTGIGRRDIETYYIIFNLLLNIIVLIVLVSIIGPIGSVIACSATWAISGFFFLFVMHRNIDLPQASTKASLLSLSVSLILVIIFRYLNSFFAVGSNRLEAIIEFVIILIVVTPIYLVLNKLLKLTPTIIPLLIGKARGKINFKR